MNQTQQVEYQDRNIRCYKCDTQFVFTAGEQLFFSDKGLKNDPKRCKQCKRKKEERIASAQAARLILEGDTFLARPKPHVICRVTCADCLIETTIPFVPTQGRPVYCRDCFLKNKEDRSAAA